MALTDLELQELNEIAYGVNEGNVTIGQIIPLDDERKVQVVALKTHENGYEGLAVAPIIDNIPDLEQVTIVSAGTTVGAVVIGTDLESVSSEKVIVPNNATISAMLGKLSVNGSPQELVLSQWIDELQQQGYGITQLSGHSQGAFSIKTGAKYHIPVTVFNGWFNYSTLTEEERAYILANPELFVNYRRKHDAVVFLNDGNNPDDDMGTIVWVFGVSHKLSEWGFDSAGNLLLYGNEQEQTNARIVQINHHTASAILLVTNLRNTWQQSGQLSKNQELYLDATETLAVVRASKEMMEVTLNGIIHQYRNTMRDIEEAWNQCLYNSLDIASNLTRYEVLDALYTGGISREGIVEERLNELATKAHEAVCMTQDFDEIAGEIQYSIQELINVDSQLAELLS